MNNATQQAFTLKPDFKWMLGRVNRVLAFGFGSRLSAVAPGTAGTLWAWAIFLVADYFFPLATISTILWALGAGFIWGCWICGCVSEELGRRDFGGIVWDEMIAFWIVLAIIMPSNLWMQVLAFALFRFFDAVKPSPIGLIDRHFKKIENSDAPSNKVQILWRGFGIMIDDLAAALFTILMLALVQMIAIHFSWM